MKTVTLFEHNEKAYAKLCETLKNNKFATKKNITHSKNE